jgi:hypothetical protein
MIARGKREACRVKSANGAQYDSQGQARSASPLEVAMKRGFQTSDAEMNLADLSGAGNV